MDTNDTSALDLTRRCTCHEFLSEIDPADPLASTRACNNCNHLLSAEGTMYHNSLESDENMLSQHFPDSESAILDHVNRSRQWTRAFSEAESNGFDSVLRDGDIFSHAAYGSDSDAYVDADPHDDEDIDNDEIEVVENTGETLVGRIQLHRSFATNGRNRPNDWLHEILSDEGIHNSERRRLFGILEDQVLETSGYVEYVDVETSRFGAPPAAVWFVNNLERVVVDEPDLVCVICKDNVCVGSVLNRLPCGHVYHPTCIVLWLNARNTCPLCRYELPTDDKDKDDQELGVQGALGESGGGRWWFVVASLVSVVGIVVMWWCRGGVFGGLRDVRSITWRSLFVNE